MQVLFVFGQSYTTVIGCDLVKEDLSRTIHYETVAVPAQPPAGHADLRQLATHAFRTVLQFLIPGLQIPIDLVGDLANQNFGLPLMAKCEEGAQTEQSQIIQAFCDLLVGIGREQRNEFLPEIGRIDNALTKSIRNCSDLRGQT